MPSCSFFLFSPRDLCLFASFCLYKVRVCSVGYSISSRTNTAYRTVGYQLWKSAKTHRIYRVRCRGCAETLTGKQVFLQGFFRAPGEFRIDFTEVPGTGVKRLQDSRNYRVRGTTPGKYSGLTKIRTLHETSLKLSFFLYFRVCVFFLLYCFDLTGYAPSVGHQVGERLGVFSEGFRH